MLRNAGFEESKDGIFPLHWGVNGAERNRCVIDSEVCHGGRQSLRVGPVESYIACQQGFGDISGLDADYKLSGWVKYESISDETLDFKTRGMPFIGIWTSGKSGNNLTFNALSLPPGTHDWQYFEKVFSYKEIEKLISRQNFARRPTRWALRINMLNQPGQVWFDDLSFVRLENKMRLKLKLDSKQYIRNNKNALVQVQLAHGSGAEQYNLKLAVTNSATKLIWQHALPWHGEELTLSIPSKSWPTGSYRLNCGIDSETVPEAEIEFAIVADPFDE
ncbi:MAG: hypothetical protein WCS95_10295 [Lentisphaeria bacterium]